MGRLFERVALVIALGCMVGTAHGEAARPGSTLASFAGRGQRLWQRACPGADASGACVRVTHAPNRNQCGDANVRRVAVRKRDPALVRRATALFATAAERYELLAPHERTESARDAAAMANYYLAQISYEELLALEFPRGLSFDPADPDLRRRSERTFTGWVSARHIVLAETTEALTDVLSIAPADSPWRVRAYARIGQAYRNYVDALVTAEIPADLRTGPYAEDTRAAYCDALQDVAAPLDERAVESFDRCVTAAATAAGTDAWKTLCASEKGRAFLLMPPVDT